MKEFKKNIKVVTLALCCIVFTALILTLTKGFL